MNWLAHLFLSERKIDQQLGNFLADPLKGRSWEGASEDIIHGMHLHKCIDAYTDSHKVVSTSKSRLRKKGLLKPVIIDLTNLDHWHSDDTSSFAKNRTKNFTIKR